MNIQSKQHNGTTGFSLVELMVVIAIVALLAAVALPTYKNYQIKSKAGVVLRAVDGYKARVLEAISLENVASLAHDNLSSGGVLLLFQNNGDGSFNTVISFGMDPSIDGVVLTFRPNGPSGDTTRFDCTYDDTNVIGTYNADFFPDCTP